MPPWSPRRSVGWSPGRSLGWTALGWILGCSPAAVAADLPDPAADWTDRAVDPAHPALVLALRRDGALYRSEDGGGTWVRVLPPLRDRQTGAGGEAPLPLELDSPDLPSPDPLDDPDDYAVLVREALEEAELRRARAVEQLRVDQETVDRPGGEPRVWFDGDAVWVVRPDGPRRSLDHGRSWAREAPPARPPPPPDPGVPSAPVRPVRPGSESGGAGDSGEGGEATPDGVPLEVLVRSTLERTALEPVRAPRSARAVPTVSLVVTRYDHHDVGVVDGGSSGWFDAAVVLQWGFGRADLDRAVDPALTDPDLVEIDGRWLVDDGAADPVLVRAIARHGADYRAGLIAGVDRLYVARQRLAGAPPEGELLDRVLRELRVQELDARLDFVSGGAVSAWADQRR